MAERQATTESAEAPFDGPWEVMTDTWGYEPQHVRGDLLRRGDTPYDLDWAEQVGSVRRAPELADRTIASTTQPLTAKGEVDEQIQRTARVEAGLAPDGGQAAATSRSTPSQEKK